ncbi:MAG: Na(+)/H(+) antiporter subunit D [Planctomycetota bacterium]
MSGSLPPPLVILLGAMLIPIFPAGRLRSLYMLALPVLSAVVLYSWPTAGEGAAGWQLEIFGQQLELMRYDSLSKPFTILFHIGALVGIVYALHLRDRMEQTASVLYVGSALGAVLAGDLITLFVFWELLAISSVFLIWARRTSHSYTVGMRYLAAQITSGLLLLSGILMHVHAGGSVSFESLIGEGGANTGLFSVDGGLRSMGLPHLLIFLGIGFKCAFPGLHNWLVDGYPEGTPTGSVFLSGFTTKVAVCVMARCFAGTEDLVVIGTIMACFPIFYAVIENDLRRVLGYSMINQIGFMMVGIGIGTDMGIDGAIAHAFNDVFFKGLLFMTMGAVLLRTGTVNGSDLGGLHKSMPYTTGFCCIGAASISAFPLFSGFVSKSLIMTAAAAEHYDVTWCLLLFAAAGVFHHAGIKIPFFAFFAHDSGRRVPEAPRNMLIAMGLAAGLCIFNGCFPSYLYSLLPYQGAGYVPYTAMHIITQLQLLFFSALAFASLMLTGLYPPELRSVNLDFDWFFRKGGRVGMALVVGPLAAVGNGILTLVLERVPSLVANTTWRRQFRLGLQSSFVETAVLVVMLLLLSFLLFNYLG